MKPVLLCKQLVSSANINHRIDTVCQDPYVGILFHVVSVHFLDIFKLTGDKNILKIAFSHLTLDRTHR